jgi:DNA repair protein RecO (recombination protein O)
MIVKSEAIVLRSIKYRETSRIVTFYTKAFGKIGGIVKGARTAKNGLGAALQPMSHVGLVLYKKEGRDLHAVSQCDLLTPFRSLAEELPRMAAGMAIIELVGNIAHEEEENVALFDLILNSLSAADAASGDPAEQFFKFEVQLAGILGFKPVFDQCVSCGKAVPDTNAEILFELERGGPLCSNCRDRHGHTVALTGKQLHYLESLHPTRHGLVEVSSSVSETDPPRHGLVEVSSSVSETDGGGAAKSLDPASKNEIERFLEAFLRKHVSGIRTSKSERVFSRLLTGS